MNSSFVLVDVIKTKVVRCFAEEMRACFMFEPGCLSQNKHPNNEHVEVKNEIRQSNPRATSSDFLREHTPAMLCINDLQDKSIGQNLMRKEAHVGEKLVFGILPDAAHLENITSLDQSKKYYRNNDTTGSVNSMDSEPGSTNTEVYVQGEVCGSTGSLRGPYGEDYSSELNGLGLDNTDELDSFTCQRVSVYSGKKTSGFSCARTCSRWPFIPSKRNSTEPASDVDCHDGHCAPLSISSEHQQSSVISGSSKPTNFPGRQEKDVIDKRCVDPPSVFVKNKEYSSEQHTFSTDLATCSTARQDFKQTCNGDSSPPVIYSSRSIPSPSKLDLSDSETTPTIFAISSQNPNGCMSNVSDSPSHPTSSHLLNLSCPNLTLLASTSPRFSVDHNPFLHSEKTQMSSSFLPQDMEDDETFTSQSPQKLEPHYKTSPFIKLTSDFGQDCVVYTDKCVNADLLLPPLLSPLNSPQKHLVISCSDENEKTCQKDVLQGNTKSRQSPMDHKIMASPASDVLTESCSSCSSDENEELYGQSSIREEDSRSFEMPENIGAEADAEDTGVLDEILAYKKDILLIDVIDDDPDLFEKVPQKILKLGPTRAREISNTERTKLVKMLLPAAEFCKIPQCLTPANIDFLCNSSSETEESPRRAWRPQCNSTSSVLQSGTEEQTKIMCPPEERTANAAQERFEFAHTFCSPPQAQSCWDKLQSPAIPNGTERNQHITTANSPHTHISPLLSTRIGPRTTNPNPMTDFRRKKVNAYCRYYFSESRNCGFKVCRFHHVPSEGDEKFCVETVARFAKNPACLYKAGAVFIGYYQNNLPGLYFSMPVLHSLLSALLKASMLSDVFAVLSTSLAHKIVPEHEFLLDLFNFVKENDLMSLVPELMQLILKMTNAGLPLSLYCLDWMKTTLKFHQTVSPNSASFSGNNRSSNLPENLNMVHAVVETELCAKQEDWKRLGKVFQSICQSNQVNDVERISGRIAVALLSESKDNVLLPFAAFAQTACHNVDENSHVRSFLGRIGVSLIFRYQKTNQWAKGQQVVEVLSAFKVSYATMKSLFGNEDGASRCQLVTVATEFFVINGSIEGALNTLRENEWFLASCMWPCEPIDLDKRTHVLLHLANKTSHRDAFEVLSNLPGLKEPNDHVDISRYRPFFSSHLQACIDRQVLTVASDMVDFMLSKELPVDHAMLRMLLHKLGKQNLWLRAREVFRHSVNEEYYPDVFSPSGVMALIVPPQLGEIELALTFEMFITVNSTAILALLENTLSTMSITLKRTEVCESDYLSAGSRLLSAACITHPKLGVHYTAVNSAQEQVFTLDISSAQRWLRHNQWANKVWTHKT